MYKWHFTTETSFEIATKEILEEMWREQNELIVRDWHPDDIKSLPHDAILFNFERLLSDDVCAILFQYLNYDTNEIEIQFCCDGCYMPGCHYLRNGDPGYPDEWDEERVITAIIVGNKTFTDKDPEFKILSEEFYDDIDDVELDNSLYEQDEPEPDLEDL